MFSQRVPHNTLESKQKLSYPQIQMFIGHIIGKTRFVGELSHDDSRLAQIAEIIRQAKAARA